MSEKFILNLPDVAPEEPTPYSYVHRDILRAVGRTIGGISTAERLAKMHTLEDVNINREVREWAQERLFASADAWQKYNHKLGVPIPNDSYGLRDMFPELDKILTHMHETATKDTKGDDKDSTIILIPYSEMLRNVGRFDEWLTELREVSGLAPDDLPRSIKKRFTDSEKGLQHHSSNSDGTAFKKYLTDKVEANGDWGMMIVRNTSATGSGAPSLRSSVTGGVSSHKYDFKSYGVAEWVADTLQRDIRGERKIILTGSKIKDPGPDSVAYGSFDPIENRYALDTLPISTPGDDVDVVPTYSVS